MTVSRSSVVPRRGDLAVTRECSHRRMRTTLAAVAILCACRDAKPPPQPQPQPQAAAPFNVNARHHVHRAPATPAGDRAFWRDTFSKPIDVAAAMKLGARLFREPALSASGALACASCHDPANAFAPSTELPVQPGGSNGIALGMRAAPSLRYLQLVPAFSEHFHDSDGDDGIDQGPAGGFDWDGRAASLHDQAMGPLFSPLEMANVSPAQLAAKLRTLPYAGDFGGAFGDDVLATDDRAIKALLVALEAYQQDPAQFYPYSSKFDDVLHGRATFTPREARGFALFTDPDKGNCARCHPSSGSHPAFTDYGFAAIGAPAVAGSHAVDLGLCGPLRTDLASHREYCGMFRTPSLRNVARRRRFFHNGSLSSLRDVLRFYSTRDSNPEAWITDLPNVYRANLDVGAPFSQRTPRLSDEDVGDLIAFLETLSDS
jgi:cytochrome c peroxidase